MIIGGSILHRRASYIIVGMHIVAEQWGGIVIGYQWINILRMSNRQWCQRKVEADICVKGIDHISNRRHTSWGNL
jgi:hypothetical protein